MELAMKLFLCLFGIQLLLSVSSEGLLFNNTAVVVGSRATLNCSSDITPYWAWRLPNNTLVATSSSGSRCIIDPLYTSSYAVSAPSVGSCNLIILSATSSDAGSYSCSDGGRVTGTPMLLVLDSGPHCSADALNNKVVYPDKVTMNCSVQYDPSNGWIPRLQWNTTDSTSPGTTGNTSYSTYIYNTSASTPIPSYSCSVVYNTSVYVDIPSCSTNPVTVFWCPTAVIISGASDGHITFGNNLTCSASGNPGPTYKWFNSTNNLLSNSSWLTVSKQDNYTCTASNNANGSPCSASNSQFVNVTTSPPVTSASVTTRPSSVTDNSGSSGTTDSGTCSTGCIIGIVVGVGGGLIIIIIIIITVCCCCRKKYTCCFCCLCCSKESRKSKKAATSTDNLTTTTAEISYNSHQNQAFDPTVPPPYDNFHGPPRGNGGSMGAIPVNQPYSYEDEVPAYADPHISQRMNGDPKSMYPNKYTIDYGDEPVQYAQLEMDNKPRSRQPLQAVEIPKEAEYEFVKRA